MTRRVLVGGSTVLAAVLSWSLLGSAALAQDPSPPTTSLSAGEPATSPATSAAPAGAGWSGTELGDARALTTTGERFVAVGADGTFPGRAAAWTSTDGLTWEPATVAGAADGTIMTTVTPSSSGLVAVGTATTEGADGPDQVAAWYSAHGLDWQRATVRRSRDEGSSAAVGSAAVGPAGVLALAEFFGQDAGIGRIYRSPDGRSWDRLRLPGPDGTVWVGTSAIPDGYLAIGRTRRGRPAIYRSNDGQTWQRARDVPALLDIAHAPDGSFVGVTARRALVSPDLSSWDPVQVGPPPEPNADTPPIDWLGWDGSQFGISGVLYEGCPENVDECYQRWLSTSIDGTTWTESTGPDGEPGPDESTQILDMATLGDTTVVLGGVGASPTLAWVMED